MPSIGLPSGAQLFLDLDAVRIVRPDLAQRDQVQQDQQRDDERQRDDVQREEARQRRIADAVVAANPFHQVRTDAGNGAEQVDDHLRAPVRHVAVGQHVAHERFGHEREVDEHADDPQQLARRLVAAVQERARHVQVDDDEEERRADRVHVLQQPAIGHFTAQVFDRVERARLARP